MKTNTIIPGALVLALWAGGPAMAIDPPPSMPPGSPPNGSAAAKTPTPDILPSNGPAPAMRADGLPVGSVTSPWTDYTRPDCCGPLCGGPIGSEFYNRNGPSIPIANGILHDTLDTGWMSEIGARTLFFNPASTLAWTIDCGLSFTINNSGASNIVYAIPLPVNTAPPELPPVIVVQDVNVTTRDFQRWSFNVSVGRDWYVWRPAYQPGCHWRIGWHAGGKYGYARLNLNDLSTLPTRIGFRHVGDVFAATAVGLHEDLEIPLGNCCSFIMGIRAEWVYNWTDIVPPNVGRDLQDVNLLVNLGWRY